MSGTAAPGLSSVPAGGEAMEQPPSPRVLVGVNHGQSDVVLHHAVRLARAFGAELVCAHVDVGRYVVEERPDGAVISRPLDPDLPELTDSDFDPALAEHIRALVAPLDVTFRELAGDRARAPRGRGADDREGRPLQGGARRDRARQGVTVREEARGGAR